MGFSKMMWEGLGVRGLGVRGWKVGCWALVSRGSGNWG